MSNRRTIGFQMPGREDDHAAAQSGPVERPPAPPGMRWTDAPSDFEIGSTPDGALLIAAPVTAPAHTFCRERFGKDAAIVAPWEDASAVALIQLLAGLGFVVGGLAAVQQ